MFIEGIVDNIATIEQRRGNSSFEELKKTKNTKITNGIKDNRPPTTNKDKKKLKISPE